MEERDKKTEMLVGLFLFIGLLLLGALILQFSSVRELFKGTYSFTVALPDGTGIRSGTPVMLGGSKIGKASDKPRLNDQFTGVLVPIEVYQTVKIAADSTFTTGTSGLLGDAFIDIKPSGKPSEKFIEPNATVQGTPAGGLGALQNTAEQVGKKVDVALEDLRGAIKDLREALKKLNEGAFSDDSMKDLRQTFSHLNSVITRLDEKTFSDETSADIKATVASLRTAAKSFEEGVKKLDPAFTKIDSVAAKADKVMDSADSAMKSVDKSAAALGNTAVELRQGEGLLPALMRDPELKNEFKTLITNLRQHGVLFYRDKTGKSGAGPADEPARTPRPLTGTKR